MKIDELQKIGYRFRFGQRKWKVRLHGTTVASGGMFANQARGRERAIEAAHVHFVKLRMDGSDIVKPNIMSVDSAARAETMKSLFEWLSKRLEKEWLQDMARTSYSTDNFIKRMEDTWRVN